ncbi:MAG: AmmeMemoRadiSam system radical SAM enzyme [Olsenella sp.]|nr:AmmeMemoRadiSam system radical SAM enzyme [Olsenella sp.]
MTARETGGGARCDACPRGCALNEGQVGFCRARACRDGRVVCESYGRVTSLAVDPIEKKPIADWRRGSTVLSVGSYGCNLRCPFCQNWQISQAGAGGVGWREVSPEQLVSLARELAEKDPRLAGVAYTYNEPLVGWEYVRDCARLAHEAGLANVLVSNGCVTGRPLDALAGLIDVANIDLKGPDQRFYDSCAGSVDAVRQTIARLAADPSCHPEVCTLVVPGENDRDEDVEKIAGWLASLPCAGDPITLHLTRFFPRWHLTDRPPTPPERVYHLADVARGHLERVRVGNC